MTLTVCILFLLRVSRYRDFVIFRDKWDQKRGQWYTNYNHFRGNLIKVEKVSIVRANKNGYHYELDSHLSQRIYSNMWNAP